MKLFLSIVIISLSFSILAKDTTTSTPTTSIEDVEKSLSLIERELKEKANIVYDKSKIAFNIKVLGVEKGFVIPAILEMDKAYSQKDFYKVNLLNASLSSVNPKLSSILSKKFDLANSEEELNGKFQNGISSQYSETVEKYDEDEISRVSGPHNEISKNINDGYIQGDQSRKGEYYREGRRSFGPDSTVASFGDGCERGYTRGGAIVGTAGTIIGGVAGFIYGGVVGANTGATTVGAGSAIIGACIGCLIGGMKDEFDREMNLNKKPKDTQKEKTKTTTPSTEPKNSTSPSENKDPKDSPSTTSTPDNSPIVSGGGSEDDNDPNHIHGSNIAKTVNPDTEEGSGNNKDKDASVLIHLLRVDVSTPVNSDDEPAFGRHTLRDPNAARPSRRLDNSTPINTGSGDDISTGKHFDLATIIHTKQIDVTNPGRRD